MAPGSARQNIAYESKRAYRRSARPTADLAGVDILIPRRSPWRPRQPVRKHQKEGTRMPLRGLGSTTFLSLFALLAFTGAANAAERPRDGYDVVIANGRIVDGSGNPWFYGNVAIKNGHIAEIGRV